METSHKAPSLPFWHPAFWIGTAFGIGRLPFAPGSWASLAALPLAWGVTGAFGQAGLAVLAILFVPVGIWAAGVYARAYEKTDPPAVVIDEVVAQWLVLSMVPREVLFYGLGFFFFRLADILKPWPIRAIERGLPGGFGIMADDGMAAVYAIGGLVLVRFLLG